MSFIKIVLIGYSSKWNGRKTGGFSHR